MMKISTLLRAVPAAKVGASNSQKITTKTMPCGIKLLLLENEKNYLPHIRLLAKAGSRYESDQKGELGMGHLFRRVIGLSNTFGSGIGTTRSLQQMGSKLTVDSTRDFLIYDMQLSNPSWVGQAFHYMMGTLPTNLMFYDWELRDQTYRYLKSDCEILWRRNFDVLLGEMLHEAAFKQKDLGNSLYFKKESVGSIGYDYIVDYATRAFAPANLTLVASGSVSMDFLEKASSKYLFNDTKTKVEVPSSKYYGSEMRYQLNKLGLTLSALAWPTAGSANPNSLAVSLLQIILGEANERIHNNASFKDQGLLNECIPDESSTGVAAFNLEYEGAGLFGIQLISNKPSEVGSVMRSLIEKIASVKDGGITEAQLTTAKNKLIMDVESHCDNPSDSLKRMGHDFALGKDVEDGKDHVSDIKRVSLSEVNKVAKEIFSGKMSMASLGNVASLPFLENL